MTEQDKTILKAICEKRGMDGISITRYQYNTERLSPEDEERRILGLLCERETLLAVFGEGWHFNIGDSHQEGMTVCDKCKLYSPWLEKEPDEFHSAWVHCWQAADRAMSGFSASERLAYYHRYMGSLADK
jgi:hypothetical protein